jgi:predicted ATPase
MIREVHIENYKSIEQLELTLGYVNVLIGENGCGKTNILEAIALASAASSDKLDNEFLASRGIRVTEPRFMRAAFAEGEPKHELRICLKSEDKIPFDYVLQSEEETTYTRWVRKLSAPEAAWVEPVGGAERRLTAKKLRELSRRFRPIVKGISDISTFLIYSPENTALRTFQNEGQILPLGIRGEGLFSHVKALSTERNRDRLAAIMEKLAVIDWFERFEIPPGLSPGERVIRIRDRYLTEGALFDQRSANEGFLFLLFYFTLFISPDTPPFFAIDNVDASLNPKLCTELIHELAGLAKKYGKQAILTTHNPAVLDGLDLNDEEQRLLVVYRNRHGHTKVRRVPKPTPIKGQPTIKLSEAFLRGYIGGLPKNF